MKTLARLTLILAVLTSSGIATAKPDADATYRDIEKTLGLVPTFFKSFPKSGIAGAWDEIKSLELNSETALSMETKELIGLAVASQIPCRYCTYFHTEVARLGGADDAEIEEAIAMAAITRHWSTILNGRQVSLKKFKRELSLIVAFLKSGKSRPGEVEVTDAASAYDDMRRTLGRVPTHLRVFPKASVAGAWREVKAVELASDTALSGKTKELIGLGVAAQIPCAYCVEFHTQAAKLYGATDDEISEAVAMAALTRHWSTILNGNQVDVKSYRKEIDRIVANARKSARR